MDIPESYMKFDEISLWPVLRLQKQAFILLADTDLYQRHWFTAIDVQWCLDRMLIVQRNEKEVAVAFVSTEDEARFAGVFTVNGSEMSCDLTSLKLSDEDGHYDDTYEEEDFFNAYGEL